MMTQGELSLKYEEDAQKPRLSWREHMDLAVWGQKAGLGRLRSLLAGDDVSGRLDLTVNEPDSVRF